MQVISNFHQVGHFTVLALKVDPLPLKVSITSGFHIKPLRASPTDHEIFPEPPYLSMVPASLQIQMETG